MKRYSSPSLSLHALSRIASRLLLILFLAAPLAASAALRLEIRGAAEGVVEEDVELKAVPSGDLPEGALIRWTINEYVVQEGEILKCRTATPGAYQITASVVQKAEGGDQVLAAAQHTLLFVPRQQADPAKPAPNPATPAQPAPAKPAPAKAAPAKAAASPARAAQAPAPGSLVWKLRDVRRNIQRNTAGKGSNSVDVTERAFVGTHRAPCGGEAISRVKWPDPPQELRPGRVLEMTLDEELELEADTDPACPGSGPTATTSARFFATHPRGIERIVDSLSESARPARTRFTKSKEIRWKIPAGNRADELAIEIGGDGPSGVGANIYTYVMGAGSATVPAAAAAPAAAPRPGEPLRIALQTGQTVFVPGDRAMLSVNVAGGQAPYGVLWSGDDVPANETGDSLTLALRQPGDREVRVHVTDSAGHTAATSVVLRVDTFSVKLVKDRPTGSRIFAGQPASFHVELFRGSRPATGNYRFRWTAEPDLGFLGLEGAQTLVAPVFLKPGRTKLAAEVLRDVGGLAEVASRSQEIELEVVAPEVKLAIDPASPLVGQEARARVTMKPAFAGVDISWTPAPAHLKAVSRSADGLETVFFATEPKPGEIRITARVPGSGDVLGRAGMTVRPRGHEVKVSAPRPVDPPAKIWKADAGLVDAGRAIAVNQRVTFDAKVDPAPSRTLAYEWKALSPKCTVKDANSAAPMVSCVETGTYAVNVTVSDDRGTVLGRGVGSFEVTVSQADIEEAEKQVRAKAMRDEASALLKDGKLEKAIETYKECVALVPDKELALHISMLEADLAQQRANEMRGRKLREEAARLEQEGRLAEAAQTYRQSLTVWPDEDVKAKLAAVEAAAAEQEARRAKGVTLRNEGVDLQKKGKGELALAKYRESLAVWPDGELEAHAAKLEAAIIARKAKQAEAARLKSDGEALEAAGDLAQAGVKYRASAAVIPDAALEKRAATIEGVVALREEASVFEDQGQLKAAAAKYRESLALLPDAAIEARAGDLEKRAAEEEARQQQARALLGEARVLDQQGELDAALAKYQDSLRLAPDVNVEAEAGVVAAKIEERRQKQAAAERLRLAAVDLEKAGQTKEAIATYRESLAIVPSAELDSYVRKMEADLAEREAKLAQSDKLRDEGLDLLERKQLPAAIEKYRQALAVWPDPDLEQKVAGLEAELKKQEELKAAAAQTAADGMALEEKGDIEGALAKYRDSLNLWADADVEQRAGKLAARLEAEKELKERAAELIAEGNELESRGKLAEAAGRYRESIRAWPNPTLAEKAAALEAEAERLASIERQVKQFTGEGETLEKQGRLAEAAEKYRASVAVRPSPELEGRIRELEGRIAAEQARQAEAGRLREAGAAQEQSGNLETALVQYRESLKLWPDSALEQKAAGIESELERIAEARAKATELASQGAKLEQDGKLAEAVEKYRESTAVLPDADLRAKADALAAQLEAESVNREQAAQLRQEAASLEASDLLAQALEKYTESLRLAPDPAVQEKAAAIEAELARRTEAQRQAGALKQAAEELERQGDARGALAKYKESLAAWPDPEVEARAGGLTLAINADEARQAEAARIRAEARDLENSGDLAGAAARYRDALQTGPDAELEKHIGILEAEVARRGADSARAAELEAQGRALEAEGRMDEALARYRESLKLQASKDLEARAQEISAQIDAEKARLAEAARLKDEARTLDEQGQAERALAMYRESVQLVPDKKVDKEILRLEKWLAQQQKTQAKLQELRAAADTLEKDGRLAEAAAKYREILEIAPDAALAARVSELEKNVAAEDARMAGAAALRDEAVALLQQSKLSEAIAKYRESLGIRPDAELEQHVKGLEAALQEQAAHKERAAGLRTEAEALEQKGQVKEAIAKYRESLQAFDDPDVKSRAEKLEQELASAESRGATAARLADEGRALEQEKRFKEAAAKYRESTALAANRVLSDRATELEWEVARQEARRIQAAKLKQAGTVQEQAGKLAEAIAQYRESLKSWPDTELETKVSGLESELADERGRVARAEALLSEGKALESAGRMAEAAAKYRESLAVRADVELEAHVGDLDAKLAREQTAQAEAARLKQEGQAQEAAGDLAGAADSFRASLKSWPDAELESRIQALEGELARQAGVKQSAAKLAAEGRALEDAGQWDSAMAKYRESLAVSADPEVESRIRAIEDRLAAEKQKLAEAAALRDEGAALEKGGQPIEAAAKYRESLAKMPDPALEARVGEIEAAAAAEKARRAEAAELRSQAEALEKAGKMREAVAAYRRSLEIREDAELAGHVGRMESEIAAEDARKSRATVLRDEAAELMKQGQLRDAIAKYRECLAVWPDEGVEQHVEMLEVQLTEQEENEAEAAILTEEGTALERQGDLAGAIAKYNAGLKLRPDAGLEKRAADLQAQIDERDRRLAAADASWQKGVELVNQKKVADALMEFRRSLEASPVPAREAYVRNLETWAERARRKAEEAALAQAAAATQVVAKAAEPAVSPAPVEEPKVEPVQAAEPEKPAEPEPVAGSRWQGVVLIRGNDGTLQWPLSLYVDEDNRISSMPGSAVDESQLTIGGMYDPSNGTFRIGFSRTEHGMTVWGTLTGSTNTAGGAGGQARLGNPGLKGNAGTGIWRVTQAK